MFSIILYLVENIADVNARNIEMKLVYARTIFSAPLKSARMFYVTFIFGQVQKACFRVVIYINRDVFELSVFVWGEAMWIMYCQHEKSATNRPFRRVNIALFVRVFSNKLCSIWRNWAAFSNVYFYEIRRAKDLCRTRFICLYTSSAKSSKDLRSKEQKEYTHFLFATKLLYSRRKIIWFFS